MCGRCALCAGVWVGVVQAAGGASRSVHSVSQQTQTSSDVSHGRDPASVWSVVHECLGPSLCLHDTHSSPSEKCTTWRVPAPAGLSHGWRAPPPAGTRRNPACARPMWNVPGTWLVPAGPGACHRRRAPGPAWLVPGGLVRSRDELDQASAVRTQHLVRMTRIGWRAHHAFRAWDIPGPPGTYHAAGTCQDRLARSATSGAYHRGLARASAGTFRGSLARTRFAGTCQARLERARRCTFQT